MLLPIQVHLLHFHLTSFDDIADISIYLFNKGNKGIKWKRKFDLKQDWIQHFVTLQGYWKVFLGYHFCFWVLSQEFPV